MEAAIALMSWAWILGRSDSERILVYQTDGLCYPTWEVDSEEPGVRGVMHKEFLLWILFCSIRGSNQVESKYSHRHRSLSRSLGTSEPCLMPGNSNGFGIISGRWFFGMNFGTILMEDMVGSGIPKSWNPYCQEHRKELLAQNLRLQWPERWKGCFVG